MICLGKDVSDKDIIARHRAGDERAFAELLARWEGRIARACRVATGGRDPRQPQIHLDDFLQHCRVELWLALDCVDLSLSDDEIGSYLRTRIKFRLTDYWREIGGVKRQKWRGVVRFSELVDEEQDDREFDPPAPAPLSAGDQREAINDLLRESPEQTRVMAMQYYVDGLTLLEIGEQWGRSESRVSQLLSAACRAARGHFVSGGEASPHAQRRYAEWSSWDDAFLLAHDGRATHRVLSRIVNRSIGSVSVRLAKLRRRR